MNYKKFDNYIKKKHKDHWFHASVDETMFKKPIVVLFGCNGCGKTRSLRALAEKYKQNNMQYVFYSTSAEGSVDYYVNGFNTDGESYKEGVIAAVSSEGEGMDRLFSVWAKQELLPALLSNKKPVRILIDEADSGLSIDRIKRNIGGLIRTIVPTELSGGRDIQVVFTANSYELFEVLQSENTQNIWVPTGDDGRNWPRPATVSSRARPCAVSQPVR